MNFCKRTILTSKTYCEGYFVNTGLLPSTFGVECNIKSHNMNNKTLYTVDNNAFLSIVEEQCNSHRWNSITIIYHPNPGHFNICYQER